MCCVSILPLRKQYFYSSSLPDLLNAALAPAITSKQTKKKKKSNYRELHISGRKKPTVITQAADDISRYVIVIFFLPTSTPSWISGTARTPVNTAEISLSATAVKNLSQPAQHRWMDYNEVVTNSSTFIYQLHVSLLQRHLCKWKTGTSLYKSGHCNVAEGARSRMPSQKKVFNLQHELCN